MEFRLHGDTDVHGKGITKLLLFKYNLNYFFPSQMPWDGYNEWQITYKVGCGNRPPTPVHVGLEGAAFLDLCFRHDPAERSTARCLLDHPFLKVAVEVGEFGSL